MKAVLILILLLCAVNTVLLVLHMKKMHQFEGFKVDRLSTYVGPYTGVASCSGVGVRNIHDSNLPIGDDSSIFYGQSQNQK